MENKNMLKLLKTIGAKWISIEKLFEKKAVIFCCIFAKNNHL